MKKCLIKGAAAFSALTLLVSATVASVSASSHREAPFISEIPKLDGTDLYAFRSYENGRDDYTVLIANYHPLQIPEGGPNYFYMDPEGVYEIHIDNDGDAKPDLTYRFRFNNKFNNATLDVNGVSVEIPLIAGVGTVASGNSSILNVNETYSVDLITYKKNGQARKAKNITNANNGFRNFVKPVDNIGNKTIPDYTAYANSHIFPINIPNCSTDGRVFVGQRQEGFAVNLGEVFDQVNLNPVGAINSESNTIKRYNITSLALEVPTECLLADNDPVIGIWTTSSLPRNRKLKNKPRVNRPTRESGGLVQVSRLANPLVNEVVIGLKDKDRFNSSQPDEDAQFATYVTNPTLPEILQALFGVTAPNLFPRTDLVSIFLTGIDGLNKTSAVAELMRLNTSIAPVPAVGQNKLGVLGSDTAGYPNGRRPGDDVVDISLRAVMGVLLDSTVAPDGQLPYNDGADIDAMDFQSTFPFLNSPNAGSPVS